MNKEIKSKFIGSYEDALSIRISLATGEVLVARFQLDSHPYREG